MTVKDALKQLKALGNEKVRAQNAKNGAGENQFGVKHGDIRRLAKKLGSSHELASSLWETGNVDAQLLAILLTKPGALSAALAEIGIHFSVLRDRAIAIGETLGIYRDYPVSKGCTSPFAPTWINVIVSRKS